MSDQPGSWTNPDNFASTPKGETILGNAYGAAEHGKQLAEDLAGKINQTINENSRIQEDLKEISMAENRAKKEFENALSNLAETKKSVPAKTKHDNLDTDIAKREHLTDAELQFKNALEATHKVQDRMETLENELKRVVKEVHEERKEESKLEDLEREIELNLEKLEESSSK